MNHTKIKNILHFIYKFVVPPSKHSLPVIETNHVMRCMKIIAVCPEDHRKHTNEFCGQKVVFLNEKVVVHTVTTGLMNARS